MSKPLFSPPGLSWDAMLKMNIPDPDMYIFFEKGAKGGISHISDRYSKASDKYLRSYDPKQESQHGIYLGANNLYGYAMSKFFPTGTFNQIDPEELDLNRYTSNSSEECVLEVDLE